MEEYSINQLSQLAGVSARTLRYYDEIGLLRPARVNEAGYRFYGPKEAAVLQQILFYRERDLDLKTIRKILLEKDFDMLAAMEEHLAELEKRKAHTEALIRTVEKTIRHMKGECEMSDQEKFEALKKKAVLEKEKAYGAEAREKYGAEAVEASNRKLMGMTETQWKRFEELEKEILKRLETAVEQGAAADSEEAEEIFGLHKEWLSASWKQYSPQAHRGVAAMYVADQRFTQYYDRNVPGCAALLKEIVERFAVD